VECNLVLAEVLNHGHLLEDLTSLVFSAVALLLLPVVEHLELHPTPSCLFLLVHLNNLLHNNIISQHQENVSGTSFKT
jgi:hypothetical protein